MARALVLQKRSALTRLELNPSQTIIAGFALIILAGSVLLSLPLAAEDGRATPFLTSLFTATSATCVTGLVVVDTASYYSLFGEIVILVLIQLGGLGYMTIATLMAMAIGRRIGLRERLVLQEAQNLYTVGGVVRFTRNVVLITLAIEGIGALLLTLRWVPEFGLARGVYFGIFHSVSAFNNAGFDLMGGFRSLTGFVGDPTVNIVFMLLIIIGGLGFTVLHALLSPRRLGLHAKIVLTTSAVLIVLGTGMLLLLEFSNRATLGGLTGQDRAMAALFQSVTPRTAGFNSIDVGKLRDPSLMLIIALMFIGASPGGTGGGIKTTTFVAPMAVILSMIRGRPDPELFRRRLPPVVIYKAVTIALVGVAFVVSAGTLLSFVEQVDFINALFEVVSGFGTVGLTTGLTPSLSSLGRIIVIITIFTGRVGLLTLAYALTRRHQPANFRYPEERIYVG